MNKFFIVLMLLILIPLSSYADGHSDTKVEQDTIKVAVVDFQRVLTESRLGKDYIKNAKKNIEKKQELLAKLEDQVRNMRDKFNEQKLVLD